jgi:hypothetical protein
MMAGANDRLAVEKLLAAVVLFCYRTVTSTTVSD